MRRRNPAAVGFNMRSLMNLLQAGAVGAGGALTVDLAMGYLPLPANMVTRTNADGSTNWLYFGTKAVFALAIGAFGRRILGRFATGMAEGALVVNIYDLFRTMLPAGVKLGYYSPAAIARPGMGAYIPGPVRAGIGAYIPGGNVVRMRASPTVGARLGAYVAEAPEGSALTTRGRVWANR